MTKLLSFLALAFGLVTLAACADSLTPAKPAAPEVMNPRELIVLTHPPSGGLIREAEALGYRLNYRRRLTNLREDLVSFTIPEGTTIPEAIAEIEAAVPGVTAGAHHLYRLQATPPASVASYAGPMIGWPAAGCRSYRRVGLMDAGVPASHTGLASGRIIQRSFAGTGAGTASNTASDPASDHGALMADLLIGPGRLTGTRLYSANVIDPAQRGGDAAGVAAMLGAVDWMQGQGVDLVNISLAGPRNKLLNRAMEAAAAKGMVFVAASGNDGPRAPAQFPAAFPYVLAVTAVDQSGAAYARAVRGDHIDFAAPGVDILLQSQGKLRVLSGTSAAAPFATAVIAADPGMRGKSVDQVRGLPAGRLRDLGPAGHDTTFGRGLLLTAPGCRGQ